MNLLTFLSIGNFIILKTSFNASFSILKIDSSDSSSDSLVAVLVSLLPQIVYRNISPRITKHYVTYLTISIILKPTI